ncbi:MAG: site-2 protease family protein [Gaiellaceae bacterium]
MNPTLTLGRVAGIRIGINWSWLIVFALIVWTLGVSVFPAQDPHLSSGTYAAMAIVAAVLFFSSLLLHELGHALQARREGVEIEGITLWLFGGVARFKGMFPSAGAELRIALAGPAVSAVLGSIFVGIAAALHQPLAIDGVAAWLGYINLLLLAFNMLPALPLDGGRVFRASLWRWKGDFASATRIAATVGRGFAYAMIGLGLLALIFGGSWSGAWLAFLGWFLLQASGLEARSVMLRDALGGLRVRDLMVRTPVVVTADSTLAEFMDDVAFPHRFTTYPVIDNDRVIGLLPFACVARVPRSAWEQTRVRDCLVPRAKVPIVREDEDLIHALDQMNTGSINRALVMDDGTLEGLLSITDVVRLVSWTEAGRRP